MRGAYIRRTWRHDPALYAPARYRRACSYDAFVPGRIAELAIDLPGDIAGLLSDAENAIADLNGRAGPELAPLGRLLLRTESIASSKVEGMQSDARALARAEANRDTGRNIGPQAAEIIANIDAMEWAVEQAATAERVTPGALQDIHRILLAGDAGRQQPGELRDEQNWIGGNDYNPCGADFVPPPPEEVTPLTEDLCSFCNDDALPPLLQAAIAHAQFETIHPFGDGNGRTGRALVQVVLRRRGLAPAFVPPISVVLARRRDRYIEGLTLFREDRVADWVAIFATATTEAARLADDYRGRVADAAGGVARAAPRALGPTCGRGRMGDHRRTARAPGRQRCRRGRRHRADATRRQQRDRRTRGGRRAHPARHVEAQPRMGGRRTTRSHRGPGGGREVVP